MNKLTKSELIEKLEDLPERGTVINVDTLQDVYIEAVKHCVSLINNTEIIPDPVPAVDTELEEAKKRFPVGSWFNFKGYGSALFKVKEVARASLGADYCDIILVKDDSDERYQAESCTPATLPTAAKWRCMKTDVENNVSDRIVRLDNINHIGWYDVAKRAWFIRGCLYIDLSRYETALWLEIPRGE